MALEKIGQKALIAKESLNVATKEKKPKLNVLDEDTYTTNLEKIIERDFFPDIPKLHAQADYFEAIERKDTQKLWQIQQKYSCKRTMATTPSTYATPSTFETPESRLAPTPAMANKNSEETADMNPESSTEIEQPAHNPEPQDEAKNLLTGISLDRYLTKNTSEDNVSFVQIMDEAEKKSRLKNSWLFDKEQEQLKEHEANVTLPSIEQQAIETTPNKVQSWRYIPNNAVMYVPDALPFSEAELIEMASKPQQEIRHKNTRFDGTPFSNEASRESITQAASLQAVMKAGRIGPDGKEILPAQSPRVAGWGFVGTPSPAPGFGASPMMTWGEIEGTPFRLDGGDTPHVHRTPGPTFKIPDVPRRDQLLHSLAEKASKAHRAKKQEALRQVAASFAAPSPKFGSSKTDRLRFLSPAAQRLASKKLGIRTHTDKALQASYTPSPTHRTPGDRTPLSLTPSPGAGKTPKSGASTPKSGVRTKRATPAREPASLTDNLLNLPKRAKAAEFF